MKLKSSLLDALRHAKYIEPTPIQAELIPHALEGRDCIGQAQTGTGKTAAFLLPFLNSWTEKDGPGPQALVLAPTRELAVQVSEEARKLAPSPACRCVPIYGGQRIGNQFVSLKKGAHIVVGPPGRGPAHSARRPLEVHKVRYD